MADPIFQLPDARTVLVLSPHPDDETLGCGGTLALYASKGADVYVAVISDGSKIYQEGASDDIDLVETRKKEARDAADVLGIRQVFFFDFPDGALVSHNEEIRERIEELASGLSPDIIFAPSPLDHHEDHRAVSSAALSFLNGGSGIKLAFYEVYGTVRFNFIVDITAVLEVKEKAVLSYTHSLYHVPHAFVEVVKGLNRFRSLHAGGKGYYEAFWIIDKLLSKTEIIDWLTYGEKKEDTIPESKADIGGENDFHDSKTCSNLIEMKEAEINGLKSALEARDRSLFDLQTRLDRIGNSYAWRTAATLYRLRDRIMPEGSLRRKHYDNLAGKLKKR